jgi:hypothetical protein
VAHRLLEPVFLAGVFTSSLAALVLILRWGPISAGHPSYLIFYVAVVVIAAASASAVLRPGRRGRPILSTVGALALLTLAMASWWLAPFPADPIAIEALSDPRGLVVTESASSITIEANGEGSGAGLIFYPGARVDARAYGRILSEIARAGHEVVILKPPLGIAFLVTGVEPDGVKAWAVGGHSLGGVAASSATSASWPEGLMLWASFPASDISDAEGLAVTSVFGTADTFATPADIDGSSDSLPEQTAFVPVEGGIHSFFGDYGIQPGDGEPGIGRDEAQQQIVEASLELLEALARR